jgi:hypothetical protein
MLVLVRNCGVPAVLARPPVVIARKEAIRELRHPLQCRAPQLGERSMTLVHMTENVERYPKLAYVEVGRGHEHGFDRVSPARSLSSETTRAPGRWPGFTSSHRPRA